MVFFHPCGLEILTFARWNWLGHWGLKIAGGPPNWNPPSVGSFLHMFIHFPCSKSFPTHILHEALNLWVNLQHHWTMTPERNIFDLSWDRNHRTGYPGNFQCRLEPSSEFLFKDGPFQNLQGGKWWYSQFLDKPKNTKTHPSHTIGASSHTPQTSGAFFWCLDDIGFLSIPPIISSMLNGLHRSPNSRTWRIIPASGFLNHKLLSSKIIDGITINHRGLPFFCNGMIDNWFMVIPKFPNQKKRFSSQITRLY